MTVADWTTPKSWASGDVLTAADMNTYVRDNTPIFYQKVTSYTLTSTVAETDLLQSSITLAANVMGSNRRMSLWASGDVLVTGSNRDLIFKYKWGATTILAFTCTITANASRGAWVLNFVTQEMNATNAQETTVHGHLIMGNNNNFGTGAGGTSNGQTIAGRNSSAVTTTSSVAVALTATHAVGTSAQETVLYAAKVAVGV